MEAVLEKRILSTCLDLFMRYGVKSVSMDDIAAELGVSKKTIYEIYKSKDDLVYLTVQEHMANEMMSIEQILKEAGNAIETMIGIAAMVLGHLRKVSPRTIYELRKYHRQAWEIFHTDLQIFIKEVITDNIKRGKREGLYYERIKEDIIASLYISMTQSLIEMEHGDEGAYPQSVLFEEMIRYHLRGIITPAGYQLLKSIEL